MKKLTIEVPVKELTIFGSVKLAISDEDFQNAGFNFGDVVNITYENGYIVKAAPYLSGFYVDRGAALIVSYPKDPNPTICYNYVSMSEKSKAQVGDMVTIELVEKGTYKAIDEALCCQYTNSRNDYATDVIFANFRAVKGGQIAANRLYRSASPFEATIGRNMYAAALCEKANINAVINLADTEDNLAKYLSETDDVVHPYAKRLINNGRVICAPVKLDYTTDSFKENITRALSKLTDYDGPYLIHCMEGKDRAGFVCALVEMLLGFSYDEVVSDYMETYRNYFGFCREDDSFKYDELVKINIFDMIAAVVGLSMEKKKEIGYEEAKRLVKSMNLSDKAREYLADAGMNEQSIDKLINILKK